MKKKWLVAMSLADDRFVEEADPTRHRRKRRSWAAVMAACMALLLTVGGLYLFLPYDTDPPDVSGYADSPYYSLIQKLNEQTYRKPVHKNNYEAILDALKEAAGSTGVPDLGGEWADQGVTSDKNDLYQEVTDNQVSGVTEADRIKRSQQYLFYLYQTRLTVYSIAGEESAELGSYQLQAEETQNYYYNEMEFYLSADCSTVTIVAPCFYKERRACVDVISLDVTDPSNIRQRGKVTVTGGYISSRLVDGQLLLITNYTPRQDQMDFDREETFLPQIDRGEGMQSIPADSIVAPEELTSLGYTVVMKMEEKNLDSCDSTAFLSYSDIVYVSRENVFVTRRYTGETVADRVTIRTTMTQIACLNYVGEHFRYDGSVSVVGYLKDQYSLDERSGVLRVVTTTQSPRYVFDYADTTDGTYAYDYGDEPVATITNISMGSNASLYCIDLAQKEIIASVEGFAPAGETVESVRFAGDSAYVCTAQVITFTDPVYFFDLSDLNNITYKETGTIEGYSSSLVDFGDGYLLGIGFGESAEVMKLEVYTEYKNEVVSVCALEKPGTEFSDQYKAYYVDRENQLLGLGICGADGYRYLVVQFDGYRLHTVLDVPISTDQDSVRGVYIAGFYYILNGYDGLILQKLF